MTRKSPRPGSAEGNPFALLAGTLLTLFGCGLFFIATDFFEYAPQFGQPPATARPTVVPSKLFSDPVNSADCAADTDANPLVAVNLIFALDPQQDYMTPAIDRFNSAYAQGIDPLTGDELADDAMRICVTGRLGSSSATTEALARTQLLGNPNNLNVLPTMFAPSASTWLTLANFLGGVEIFAQDAIQPVALTPLVIAMWESRLQAIEATTNSSAVGWADVLDVFNSAGGWADYGIPDGRRAVYYGYTDPRSSSSGLSALISEFYAAARAAGELDAGQRTLTLEMVNNSDVRAGVREIETLVRHYAPRTDTYLDYIAQGPAYLDMVALEEIDLLYLNGAFADEGFASPYTPPEPLVALYPQEGTIWHERPVAILGTDWVTDEQREASRVFQQYLLTPQIQETVAQRGFRPANAAVAVAYPLVPEFGVQPTVNAPMLEIPDLEALVAIQQSWPLVKKQADVYLLFDVSSSMNDNDKLAQAQAAAAAFVEEMDADNRVGLVTFAGEVEVVAPLGLLGSNQADLISAINGLRANGDTELYIAVRETVQRLQASDPDRIRAVVLLSSGEDTGEQGFSINDALQAIRETQDSQNPVIVVPLAYGDNADISALGDIARTSATRVQSSAPGDIDDVLDAIRQYF